jgi:hypothetical protein
MLYPCDWSEVSYFIRIANDWRCMECDKQCRRPGELYLGWEYTLTVAHICQDYDGEAIYVAPLCLPCHLAFDAPHSWIARRRQLRWRLHHAGQLTMPL